MGARVSPYIHRNACNYPRGPGGPSLRQRPRCYVIQRTRHGNEAEYYVTDFLLLREPDHTTHKNGEPLCRNVGSSRNRQNSSDMRAGSPTLTVPLRLLVGPSAPAGNITPLLAGSSASSSIGAALLLEVGTLVVGLIRVEAHVGGVERLQIGESLRGARGLKS